MRAWICAFLAAVCIEPAIAHGQALPQFGEGWHVAPSPDPDRLQVEVGESLRIRGLMEVPYPASCGAFAAKPYRVDEGSILRLQLKRGHVKTDSLHFRYGLALVSGGTRVVLFHHLAPGWNGARGWTLDRTTRDAKDKPEMTQATLFDLRDELIASYPSKFSMPAFFDNTEDVAIEVTQHGLQITRNGSSKSVAFEISGEFEVFFFVAADFFPIEIDFELNDLRVEGTVGGKPLTLGPASYLASVSLVEKLKQLPPAETFDPSKGTAQANSEQKWLGVTLRGSWPTARWYEFIDKSQSIGYNMMSLDIPWGQVERAPGVFDFERFDHLIAYAANRGYALQIKPWWVRCSYPIWVCPDLEQLCHPADGATWAPQLTFADRDLNARIARYAKEIARRYQGYPNVVYTPVCGPSAEMEYSHGQYCDYGQPAMVRFGQWLERKYREIDVLNQAWGSAHEGFSAAKPPLLGRKALRDSPDLDPSFLDFMAFREDLLRELLADIYSSMKAADPDCKLGVQIGRTHDGPLLAYRGTPGIHYWAAPYEWIIADPQPQKRTDSAGYIVDFIRAGNKFAGVEQTTYVSYADDPAAFWEFTWQSWEHGSPLMLIANCAPYDSDLGVQISRKCAERLGRMTNINRPKAAMFVSKWELYAWHRGERWLECRKAYQRLTGGGELVIDVINGDMIQNVPGLLEWYDRIVVPFGDVIDEREESALASHADKVVVESPELFGKTVLKDIFPDQPATR